MMIVVTPILDENQMIDEMQLQQGFHQSVNHPGNNVTPQLNLYQFFYAEAWNYSHEPWFSRLDPGKGRPAIPE
jgi:hypothetical protein